MADKIYDAYHQEIELTEEQQACLKYTGDRTLMVKGYAGAGKSLVLMQAARQLLEKYGPGVKNKIAIFTFQNTLVSTTREFLQVNGAPEDGVVVTTINSYVRDLYGFLVSINKAPRRNYPYSGKAGETQRINNIKQAKRAHRTKYGKHRFHDIDDQFWIEEFDWMKEMNIWKDDMDIYRSMPRKGRGGKVRMSSADRITAYQLFTCYCEHLEKTKQADWDDDTLFIVRNPELIPENMKYDYILIDEAQDLSLAQMTAIMMLCNKRMVVAMDANQRIFKRQWTAKQLGIETTTKKLTKSMRTTKQIDALAESIRSKNDLILSEDDRSLRAIPEREWDIPELIHLEDSASERKYIINRIKKILDDNDRITIGIIAAKNSQIKIYADWLASDNIQYEQIKKDMTFSMAKPGVKLVTAYGAKGLEFDVVIIPMFVEGNFPYGYQPDDEELYEQYMIQMRNLVYVSMTRAKSNLIITYWGNGSRFIADMDPSLYKLVGKKPDIKVPKFREETEELDLSDLNTSDILWKSKPTVVDKIIEKEKDSNSKGKSRSPFLKTDYTSSGSSNVKKNLPTKEAFSSASNSKLVDFLKAKGIEVIDNRSKQGALWIIGDKSIDSIIQETKKKFGARWTYKEEGGFATKHRPSWYTKSEK